jgi:hypothetical protein
MEEDWKVAWQRYHDEAAAAIAAGTLTAQCSNALERDKRRRQERSREAVRSGALKQADLFLISPEAPINATYTFKP